MYLEKSLHSVPFFCIMVGQLIVLVTRSRRHSLDIVQGGLEIPCTLVFQIGGDRNIQQMEKTEKLVLLILAPSPTCMPVMPPSKKIGIDDNI